MQFYRTFNVVQFAKKLDGLLELLDVTTDGLAAEWDQRAEAPSTEFDGSGDFNPTIQVKEKRDASSNGRDWGLPDYDGQKKNRPDSQHLLAFSYS